MSSRNVAVQQAVYDALSREKRPGESFTGLFRRLLEQRGRVEDIAGSWDRAGLKRDRQILRELRGGGRRR